MNPILRTVFSVTVLSAAGLAFAAPGDMPPPQSMDLGAMKLKPQSAAPVAAPAAMPAPAPAPAKVTPAGMVPTNLGSKSVVQTATQNVAQTAAPSGSSSSSNNADTGVGTVVNPSAGRHRATDMLSRQSDNAQQQQSNSSSNDLQVKLPSLMRR